GGRACARAPPRRQIATEMGVKEDPEL
ncbi:hypothetical protein A2U01_0076958, partial [Trifolium medium]|nr:hypothetical protein [Trifolium medium]